MGIFHGKLSKNQMETISNQIDLPRHRAKTCEATEFSAACAQQSDYYAGSTKCQGLTRGKCLGYSEDHIDHPTWQGNQGRVAGTTVHLLKCPVKQMGLSENSVPLNPMVNDHYPY